MTPQTPDILDVWKCILDAHDAPTDTVQTGRPIYDALVRAEKMYDDARKRAGELREQSADLARNLQPALRKEITGGKRHTLSTMLESIDNAERACALAKRAETETRIAVHYFRNALATTADEHRPALVAWIAKRRHADHTANGHTDHVTPELESVYVWLAVRWFPKWPEGIEFRDGATLPVVYQERMDTDTRRRVEWCWSQVAAGDCRWVPHPHQRDTNADPIMLRILGWYDKGPSPTPATNTEPQERKISGIGLSKS